MVWGMAMNVKQISVDLERILRLRTHPVGVRLCEKAEDLTKGNVPSAKVSLCQMVKGAAHGGWLSSSTAVLQAICVDSAWTKWTPVA